MPFGKQSQQSVPKPHMVKTHAGMGNHKQVIHSHAAVRANAGLKAAPTNQPNSGLGNTGHNSMK